MIKKRIEITLRLEYEGAGIEGVGWPDFRTLVDSFTKALEAMPNGPKKQSVLPVGLQNGSLALLFLLPSDGVKGMQTLGNGPQRNWTRAMYEGTSDFYKLIREKGATVSTLIHGQRKNFKIPPEPTTIVINQYETLYGQVFRAGGQGGTVEIDIENEKNLKFGAGLDLAPKMAKHLYKRVEIYAKTQREYPSMAFQGGQILDFCPLPDPKTPEQAIQNILEAAGPDFRIDVKEFMKEMRG